nr:hypothetical protein BgiMline_004454 [Biomphalaria glabrata]
MVAEEHWSLQNAHSEQLFTYLSQKKGQCEVLTIALSSDAIIRPSVIDEMVEGLTRVSKQEVVFSNSWKEVVFSNSWKEVVFSNSWKEVVFSNSWKEVVFSNSWKEVVFSNSWKEVVFSNS